MARMILSVGLILAACAVLPGCAGGVKEKTYEVKSVSGLDQAKQLLQRYAEGQPLGSEVTSYPQIVEEVKKTDPQKAAILEKGFADLQKSPGAPAATAKALLRQL